MIAKTEDRRPENELIKRNGEARLLHEPLSAGERRALGRCERVIKRGAKAFVAVGIALAEVRDRRLYREQYNSFESYCIAKFNIGRAHAYRLLDSAAAIADLQKLSPIGDIVVNEGQARELVRVPSEMRPEVLRLAAELSEGGDLTARNIRQAAVDLGAVSENKIMPGGGDDGIRTPDWLSEAIIKHFMPSGRCVDPCKGDGAFTKFMPDCDWFELTQERDFLDAKGHWDWCVSNPPFSQFRSFLQKSMEVANNVVFVGLVNAWFVKRRQQDIREAGFGLVEICELPVPKTWPQFGLTLAATWIRRGWEGGIAHTRLEVREGSNYS